MLLGHDDHRLHRWCSRSCIRRPRRAVASPWPLTCTGLFGAAGVVQVLRLRLGQRRQPHPRRGAGRSRAPFAGGAPHRHFLLHVHGAELRDRHLPAATTAGAATWTWRSTSRSSLSARRPDRPRRRAAAPAAPAPGSEGRRLLPCLVVDHGRALQEGGDLLVRLDRHCGAGLHGAGAALGPEAIFAAWGYAVQIYCDFSGYTDIAIGLALLLGIEFPINFDAPYTAGNLQDFWRRWHITLSRWLRDYLYIPLGGSSGRRHRPSATSSSPWCLAACGTGRHGRSCSGGRCTGSGKGWGTCAAGGG